jgi:hypothetical protein
MTSTLVVAVSVGAIVVGRRAKSVAMVAGTSVRRAPIGPAAFGVVTVARELTL